jgi:hypothetical protein
MDRDLMPLHRNLDPKGEQGLALRAVALLVPAAGQALCCREDPALIRTLRRKHRCGPQRIEQLRPIGEEAGDPRDDDLLQRGRGQAEGIGVVIPRAGDQAVRDIVPIPSPGSRSAATDIRLAVDRGEFFLAHTFEYACAENYIDHRLTKPRHLWTNGQVERMNRTLKVATVRRFHYETHDQLRSHLTDFVNTYNFGRRLKTLKGLTPYEAICKSWTAEPERFTLNPLHKCQDQTSSGRPSFSARRRAVCPGGGAVDHLHPARAGRGQRGEDRQPDAALRPAVIRLSIVVGGPWQPGQSCQRQPFFSMCTMPLITRRSSVRRAPGWFRGRCSSSAVHCVSDSQNSPAIDQAPPPTTEPEA